ncbi:MAG TPA: hypothetical protein VK118_04050 [Tetragenococcus sp.]|nr:hypothetical protein [Tetragenococcus sp.]
MLWQAFEELLANGGSLIVIDMGAGAGEKGGKILFEGSPGELLHCEASVTARYLKKYLGM